MEKIYNSPLNKSGTMPHDLKVMVLLDIIEEKTAGGILLPEKDQKRLQLTCQTATLVAVGKNAFKEWNGDHPKVGDKVTIGLYSGNEIRKPSGEIYKLLNDLDIWGSVIGE